MSNATLPQSTVKSAATIPAPDSPALTLSAFGSLPGEFRVSTKTIRRLDESGNLPAAGSRWPCQAPVLRVDRSMDR